MKKGGQKILVVYLDTTGLIKVKYTLNNNIYNLVIICNIMKIYGDKGLCTDLKDKLESPSQLPVVEISSSLCI